MTLGDTKTKKNKRQGRQKGAHGTKSEPKETKSEPKMSQRESKVIQNEPKVSKRTPKGIQKWANFNIELWNPRAP